jgi:outer membrane protein OmpA-like peptidoglycan-associated protein
MRKRRLLVLAFGLMLAFNGYAQSDSEVQSESKGNFFFSVGLYNGFFSNGPIVPIPNFEIKKLFVATVSGNYELPLGQGKTAFGLEAGYSSGSRFGGSGNVDFIPFGFSAAYVYPLARNFYIGPRLKIGGLGLLGPDWNDVVLMAGARLEAELRSTDFPFGLFVAGGIDIFPLAPEFATLPVIEVGLRFPRGKLKKSSSSDTAKNKEQGTNTGGAGAAAGAATGAGTGAATGQGAASGTGAGATQGQSAAGGAGATTGSTTGAGTGAATGQGATSGTGAGVTQGQSAAGGAGAAAAGATTGAGTGAATGQGAASGTGAAGAGTVAGASAAGSTTGAGTGAATGQGAASGTGAGATQGQSTAGGAGAAAGIGPITGGTQGQNRSIILEDGKQGVLNSIYFEPDTAVLIESYRSTLDAVGRQLAADPSLKLLIRAYAANFGTADGRYIVSANRARFSRDFFTVQYGISANRFNIEAYGADRTPIYATDDWQSHRCVELILFRE